MDKLVWLKRLKTLPDGFKGPGDTALHEAAGLIESHTEDPIHVIFPIAVRILGQQRARLDSALEVIDSEVGGIRVRNIDSDHGDFGDLEDVGNARTNRFLGLELKHQIDPPLDEAMGVVDGRLHVESVIKDDQLNTGRGGSDVATVRERLKDAIHARLGDVGVLVDLLKTEAP